jgi:hypothetical protein
LKKPLISILLLICASLSFSGEYIVIEGTITAIANTNGNGENFTVWIEGGTGPCANAGITFPIAAAGSDKVFERAYATALAAYMAGKKVTIHDYAGDSCTNASYIRVLN